MVDRIRKPGSQLTPKEQGESTPKSRSDISEGIFHELAKIQLSMEENFTIVNEKISQLHEKVEKIEDKVKTLE